MLKKGATAKGGMTDQQFVDMAGQTDLIEAQIGQMVQDMKTGTARMLRSECSRRGKIVSIERVIANSLTGSGIGNGMSGRII